MKKVTSEIMGTAVLTVIKTTTHARLHAHYERLGISRDVIYPAAAAMVSTRTPDDEPAPSAVADFIMGFMVGLECARLMEGEEDGTT